VENVLLGSDQEFLGKMERYEPAAGCCCPMIWATISLSLGEWRFIPLLVWRIVKALWGRGFKWSMEEVVLVESLALICDCRP